MIRWILVAAIIILVLCIAECIREIFVFKVTHYNIESEKLNSLKEQKKIIFLSDLHNFRYGKNNEKLIAAIRKENPDLILIGGDMLVGAPGRDDIPAREFVKQLVPICPIYHGKGNHEQRMEAEPEKYGVVFHEYKEAITKEGVTFLENEQATVSLNDCQIRICGIDLPEGCYFKFGKAIPFSVEDAINTIGQADTNNFQILMVHNPEYAETFAAWGADLILSGHVHGGMIRIPGIGGVLSPQWKFFPKYSGGHQKIKDASLVISCGIGIHTIPLRFLNPAEVIVLHLRGKE